ncbi:MAG: DinB family protein [Armatimonadota bacterium]
MARELIDDLIGRTKRAFEDLLQHTEGLTEEQATQSPHPNVKSIWECVMHVAWCKRHHADHAFGTHTVFDWDAREQVCPTFADARRLLQDAHGEVFKHLCALQDDRELQRTVKNPEGEQVRLRQVLQTLINHDLYHLGQLVLMRQMLGLSA